MNKRIAKYLVATIVLVFSVIAYSKSIPMGTGLASIKQRGELIVVTRDSATTYYQGANGKPAGFEYDLAKRFADDLGVQLKVIVAANIPESLKMVERGEADMSIAGVTVTELRKRDFRFGPAYQEIYQQVVYRQGTETPTQIQDLYSRNIELVSGSSAAERFKKLQADHPALSWTETSQYNSEELITRVGRNELGYTVAYSNEIALFQRFYPALRTGLKLDMPLPVAWAFSKNVDSELYDSAVEFFKQIRQNGELASVVERYYGHTTNFSSNRANDFFALVYKRLPAYRKHFEQAAKDTDLDWRLLAAVGFQESEWNPKAVSATGVRGMMMLTREVARDLGIKQRDSAHQSITGGAQYLKQMREQLAAVPEPDRTWLALAAYNAGIGTLTEARALARKKGKNPDVWLDVKQMLPHVKINTRRHSIRGIEAVRYVDNIRNYFDVLIHITNTTRRNMTIATSRQAEALAA